MNKTYSARSSHDAKLSYKKRNQFRSNYVGDSNPEMLESLASDWPIEFCSKNFKNHTVKLLDMTESICCFYWSSPICKNSIIAPFSLDILQIQYWQLLLVWQYVTAHTYMNGFNQVYVFLCASTIVKKSTSYLSLFLR